MDGEIRNSKLARDQIQSQKIEYIEKLTFLYGEIINIIKRNVKNI